MVGDYVLNFFCIEHQKSMGNPYKMLNIKKTSCIQLGNLDSEKKRRWGSSSEACVKQLTYRERGAEEEGEEEKEREKEEEGEREREVENGFSPLNIILKLTAKFLLLNEV